MTDRNLRPRVHERNAFVAEAVVRNVCAETSTTRSKRKKKPLQVATTVATRAVRSIRTPRVVPLRRELRLEGEVHVGEVSAGGIPAGVTEGIEAALVLAAAAGLWGVFARQPAVIKLRVRNRVGQLSR